MSKRYLFLMAWVVGSEGAYGDATRVHSQSDLMPEYLKGNEHIFAVEIVDGCNPFNWECVLPPVDIAYALGCKEAFDNNYTAYDTVSVIDELDDSFQHPAPVKTIQL